MKSISEGLCTWRPRLPCAHCRSSQGRLPRNARAAPRLRLRAPLRRRKGPARGQGRGGFGGGGDVKVLLITKGHAYDREPFYQLFDQPPVGASARWTHVEQPAAEVFFDPALAKDYDVFVFYDINGNQADRRKPRMDKTGKPVPNKDGSPAFTWDRAARRSRCEHEGAAAAGQADDLPASRVGVVGAQLARVHRGDGHRV